MDEFFLQVSELARAGWSLQILPEQAEPTLPPIHAEVLWSFKSNSAMSEREREIYPLVDWINLFAPELELRRVVAKMHKRVFRHPPFGNLPV